VELRVSDTGAGIPPERLATIWQPYVTNKPGGTGLGLAIVRQTVLAHHGRVDASSTKEEGTEIVMALPIDGSGMETETEEE
jgi:two-component system, NtrC family, sensor histidine kinase HydH